MFSARECQLSRELYSIISVTATFLVHIGAYDEELRRKFPSNQSGLHKLQIHGSTACIQS